LEIGNGDFNADVSVESLRRAQVHFTMWSIMKSPLIISTDLEKLGEKSLNVLSNKEVIAINQDPLGIQAGIIESHPITLTPNPNP